MVKSQRPCARTRFTLTTIVHAHVGNMASYDDLLKSDDFEQSLLDVDLDVDQIVNRSTSVNTSGSSATAIAGTEIAGGKKRDGSKQPRDMYAPSTFGGIGALVVRDAVADCPDIVPSALTRRFLGDFMRNKRLKLDVQNQALLEQVDGNDSEDGIDAHNKVDLKPRERRPQVFDGCHVYVSRGLSSSVPLSLKQARLDALRSTDTSQRRTLFALSSVYSLFTADDTYPTWIGNLS